MSSTLKSRFAKGLLTIAVLCPILAFAPAALANLRLGDRGQAVVDLQDRLAIPADGVYGAQTEAAVIEFQRANGLFDDGIAGRQTLSALGLDPESQPTSQGDLFLRADAAEGPYQVVVPGNDTEELSRTRRVVDSAEFADDPDRGEYIDAGRYANRSIARDVAAQLEDLNLDARVEFRD